MSKLPHAHKDSSPATMKELADANHIPKLGANSATQAEAFEQATARGRSIMKTGAVERQDADIQSQPVPRSGYIAAADEATARGREQMEAGRRGERNFPPAWRVVKP